MKPTAFGIFKEQPRITAALDEATAQLPVSVRAVACHVLNAGGKRLRPLLTVCMAHLLGYNKPDIYPLAAAVEMAHMATLLHDDVLDSATLRRGKPAAHQTFGMHSTILGGDALLAKATQIVAATQNPHMIHAFAEAIIRTAEGEILEIEHQGTFPPLPVYYAIIEGKTAWMIRMASEVGALCAKADPQQVEAAAEFGLNLGMAFQIVDDALDFAPANQTGKPEGGDVREGKFTPPLQMYRDALAPEPRLAFEIWFASRSGNNGLGNNGSGNEDPVQNIINTVKQNGFDKQTRTLAESFLIKTHNALERLARGLPKGVEYHALEAVINHVRTREK